MVHFPEYFHLTQYFSAPLHYGNGPPERFVPDGLEEIFFHNFHREGSGHGIVRITASQNSGRKRNSLPLQTAVDRDARSAADDENLWRSGSGIQL